MTDRTDTTILLDIYQRLGTIEEQLRSITKSHYEQGREIEGLRDFKTRFSSYIWLGGTIVSGVLFFLWQGLAYWSVELKAWLLRLFH